MFWKKKARVQWHHSGDRNTFFFHRVTKISNATQGIKSLIHEGQILSNQNDIEKVGIDYFQDL